MMRCSLCNFLIIKPQTTLHYAIQYTITCGGVQLYHFTGDFYHFVNTLSDNPNCHQ